MRNDELENLTKELKKASIENNVKIWKRVATDLERSRRMRRVVDVAKIDKCCKEGETAVVPGKVLGTTKTKIHIVAYNASEAVMKNNKFTSLIDYIKKNPKGTKCRIMG